MLKCGYVNVYSWGLSFSEMQSLFIGITSVKQYVLYYFMFIFYLFVSCSSFQTEEDIAAFVQYELLYVRCSASFEHIWVAALVCYKAILMLFGSFLSLQTRYGNQFTIWHTSSQSIQKDKLLQPHSKKEKEKKNTHTQNEKDKTTND